MSEICPKCGLPKELCVCDEISKDKEKIKITMQKRRFNKKYTIIEGFEKGTDIKKISKELKNKLACGGTSKKEHIELQGDHRTKAKEILIKMNYSENQIDVQWKKKR